jgi:hypothetical protein
MGVTERTSGVLSTFVFEGELSDEEFDGYIARLEELITRRTPYVVVVEATRSKAMSGKQARKMADWTKLRAEELRTYCRGIAFVIPSLFVRGILRAIFTMQPPPYPSKVVETTEQALEWLRPRAPGPLPSQV